MEKAESVKFGDEIGQGARRVFHPRWVSVVRLAIGVGSLTLLLAGPVLAQEAGVSPAINQTHVKSQAVEVAPFRGASLASGLVVEQSGQIGGKVVPVLPPVSADVEPMRSQCAGKVGGNADGNPNREFLYGHLYGTVLTLLGVWTWFWLDGLRASREHRRKMEALRAQRDAES
jgi:hypothetical protein